MAIIAGAFERTSTPGLRRGSGGGTVHVSPGTLWMQLVLERSEHPPDKLLNRHVRPLLRALTKVTSLPAHYFGRDWISMKQRPVAFIGFAHDATSGRVLIEAVVAFGARFAVSRPSFMGVAPATLDELTGTTIAADALVNAISSGYAMPLTDDGPTTPAATIAEPAWTATIDEAMGIVAAGPDACGRFRVGGEFMASTDAIARLEAGADVDAAFVGSVLFGARTTSLAEVISTASAQLGPTRALP
jgi:hypothetical protein